MAEILIIDDDLLLCGSLLHLIDRLGHNGIEAHTLGEGRKLLESKPFDIALLDVRLPDGSGLDLLPAIHKQPASPQVIIITSAGDPDGAELAIKNGAWDYIEKPFSRQNITLEITRALEHRNVKIKSSPALIQREKIVGSSPLMQKSIGLLAKAARTDATALITGETGTGKELFARAVHENSSRSGNSFVVVDCGAIPENLIEGQLFGAKKGAFTGADRNMVGLVKQADGGTLFMDEVGELSLAFQKVFLRTLQEHRFRPLGATLEEESDFRLVAATNRDLPAMVQEGLFREDLLFRLRAVTIEIPPLRKRPGDIKDISLQYTAEFCERNTIGTKGFSYDFFDTLCNYQWPGNVRELIHTLEWMITEHQDIAELTPKHLPEYIRIKLLRASIKSSDHTETCPAQKQCTPETFQSIKEFRQQKVAEAEKKYLLDLIAAVDGDVRKACGISQLSRTHFYSLLKKHGIVLKN